MSKGAKHYGKGGAYEGFTGKDASRSFVSGDFTEVGEETSLALCFLRHLFSVESCVEIFCCG